MFQQTYRPEIARVAEETVLNLKQLESRIEVLKNDLAALCTVIGHPEAARVAVTPTSWLGVTAPHLTGQVPNLTGVQGMLPFAQGISPLSQGITPFQGGVSPLTQGISPFAQGFSPYAPGISPLTQGFSPFQGISPVSQGITPFGASLGISPLSYGNPLVNPLLAQGFPGFR